MREHPPYSWPKDHPGREAAIRERKLARRNQKIHGSHPATQIVPREMPNNVIPKQPNQTPIPSSATPTPDPTVSSPQEHQPLLGTTNDLTPTAIDPTPAEPHIPDPKSIPDSPAPVETPIEPHHDGDDSVTAEQAPPTTERPNPDLDVHDSVDPVAPVNLAPLDATEELVPGAEVPTHSPQPPSEVVTTEQTPDNHATTTSVVPDSPVDPDTPVDADVSVDLQQSTEPDDSMLSSEEPIEQEKSVEQEEPVQPMESMEPTVGDEGSEQQYADADEPDSDVPAVSAESIMSSIDTRRAMFDRAEDRLPEAKEMKRDVLDPVTNEFISLTEYRQRQRERAQGVVRERVEKFEEIDDELSRQKAKLAAIEAARTEAKEKVTWSFKDKSLPRSPMSNRDSGSYMNDIDKYVDAHELPNGKPESIEKDEAISSNLRAVDDADGLKLSSNLVPEDNSDGYVPNKREGIVLPTA